MIIAKIKSSFNRYSLLLITKTQLFFAHIAHLNETVYKTVKTRNQSLLLTKPRSDFEIWININPTTVIKDGRISSAGIMIHLKRDGLGLLMGSFYAPTGIFAILAMTSYVINPDAVSYA